MKKTEKENNTKDNRKSAPLLRFFAFLSFRSFILSYFYLSFVFRASFFVLLLWFCTWQPLGAQHRLDVIYHDNSPKAQEIIARQNLKQEYKTIKGLKRDVQKLITSLHRNFFSLATVDTFLFDKNNCTADIYIGQRQIITRIEVVGCDSLRGKAQKNIRLLTQRKVHTLHEVITYNQAISSNLWNNGYPFAVSQIQELLQDTGGQKAVIVVTPNHYITLDSIILMGNLKLSKSFLFGYLGIRRKGAYQESVIRRTEANLHRLPFVTLTQSPSVGFSQDKSALYIYANKKKVNQFDGYIGIVPADNQKSKVLLTGSVLLNLTNICTIGENLKLHWQRIQRGSQTLDISADFPYLFHTSFGLDGIFFMDKRDTAFLTLHASAAVRYYLQQNNYLRGFYEYRTSRLLQNEGLQQLTTLPDNIDFKAHFYGLELCMERLDNAFSPQRGYGFVFNASVGTRKIVSNVNLADSLYRNILLSSTQLKLQAGLVLYVPLHKRWIWRLGTKGGYLFAPNLFENELFAIGGFSTIRGFEERSLYANAYAVVSNELRFLFVRSFYLQLFFDVGWYERRLLRSYQSGFPFGFGTGISFDTKAGVFALNYALGKHPQNPFKLSAGIISFGYTAVF